MAEHLMETTVRTALWQQFSAAIAMLENALLACPETLWQEHLWIDVESADEGTFWEITYHTLGCLDRFLTGCSLEALPVFKKRSDGVIPRDELHPYLVQLRQTVPDHVCCLVRRASAPAVHVPLARRSDRELFRTLIVHPAPRAGTCGSTEPLSRTARHPGRGAPLGSACEGGSRPALARMFPMCKSLSVFAPFECAPLSASDDGVFCSEEGKLIDENSFFCRQ